MRMILFPTLLSMLIACAPARQPVPPEPPTCVNDRPSTSGRSKIVVIADDHYSPRCQASIYATLERELLCSRKKLIVAREGRTGPTEHTSNDFQTMRYFDHDGEIKHYKTIITGDHELKVLMLQIMSSNALMWPKQYHEDGPTFTAPCKAAVMLEAVYQDDVITFGVEDKEIYGAAMLALLDGDLSEADRELVYGAREEWIIKNTLALSAWGLPIALVVGADHAKTITEQILIARGFPQVSTDVSLLLHPSCIDE